jgi:hypothetical protein
MQSLGNDVAGLLRCNYNPDLFVQHCILHRQVLAAKDGLSLIPSYVHKTIDDVMNCFRRSHVRKDKLQAIIQMSEENLEYQRLVSYHEVRWLSLSECVERFVDLHSEIVLYFEQESANARSSAERSRL